MSFEYSQNISAVIRERIFATGRTTTMLELLAAAAGAWGVSTNLSQSEIPPSVDRTTGEGSTVLQCVPDEFAPLVLSTAPSLHWEDCLVSSDRSLLQRASPRVQLGPKK